MEVKEPDAWERFYGDVPAPSLEARESFNHHWKKLGEAEAKMRERVVWEILRKQQGG